MRNWWGKSTVPVAGLRSTRGFCLIALIVSLFGPAIPGALPVSGLSGTLTDPQGLAVSGATIRLDRRADASRRETKTDDGGQFSFADTSSGEYRLIAEFPGFPTLTRTVVVSANDVKIENLQFSTVASQNESVTVAADVSDAGLFAPDPAQRLVVREETLDANPGRPGMPISIPGLPVESPAGGVKPPPYFVPGVAGDHGGPIAMFFQVGGFLFQNNLPANAHGNGYADPNVIIPVAIETVQTDGGAFNVREGNNSVNTAIVFGLRDRLQSMARLSANYRDLNFVGAWSPKNPANKSWVGAEISSAGTSQTMQRECLESFQFRQTRIDHLRHRILRLRLPTGLDPH